MILCEGVKFGTLSLTGSKCTHQVIYLFKQTIKQTIYSVNFAMARWIKHENKCIIYLIMEKKKNESVYLWELSDIHAETDSNWLT